MGATVPAVLRRRAPLLLAALALLAAVVAVVLLLRGGGDDKPKQAASAEPLAYVPAGTADVVFDLDTREPLVALAVEQLAPRVTHGALSADQVARAGRRARRRGDRRRQGVAGLRHRRAGAAADRGARPPRRATGSSSSRRARRTSRRRSTRAARARRPATRARPSTSASRACRPTPARASPSTRSRCSRQRSPQIADTRLGPLARDGAAVLPTSGASCASRFASPPTRVGLKPADLPIATGPQPPQARGSAPLVVGLRDPAHTLAFAAPAGLLPAARRCSTSCPASCKPDLNDLGPERHGDEHDASTSTTSPRASSPPTPATGRPSSDGIDTLAGLAGEPVPGGLEIDQRDGAYTITQNGKLVARAGVYGRALVLSNDPTADLRAAAAAPAAPTPPGAAGALTARLRSSVLATQIPELIRARVGDLTAWARAELTGVTGELRLALR